MVIWFQHFKGKKGDICGLIDFGTVVNASRWSERSFLTSRKAMHDAMINWHFFIELEKAKPNISINGSKMLFKRNVDTLRFSATYVINVPIMGVVMIS